MKEIFSTKVEELQNYLDRAGQKNLLLAYSGGKDSTILLQLAEFLRLEGIIQEFWVYHLNHQIRENQIQETAIRNFLERGWGTKSIVKKKIFQSYPNDLPFHWKNVVDYCVIAT